MIFPIGDTNVKGGYKPYISYSFIGINILVFLVQYNFAGRLYCDYAAIPNELLAGDKLFTVFTSMFMHGGWMHLIGNMMFIWVFADNIEAVLGNVPFLLFYIAGGLVATALHVGAEYITLPDVLEGCCKPCVAGMGCSVETNIPACPTFAPTVGASGAISAVLGAYMVFFPKSKIKVFFFISTFSVPALLFLGFWFLEQIISGVGAFSAIGLGGGVAWWAHIGGFLFGLAYGLLNKNRIRSMMESA